MAHALTGKRYWIIGASEGLGRALAAQMDAEGASLVLSARNASRIEALAETLTDARALPIDVTDQSSVETAATAAGQIDGVVYCVGQYDPLAAANWNSEAVMAMAEANYMGALRVLGEIVPGFTERNAGHIVLIGSLAGFRGLPGAIGYGSSKAALMHLGENLYADLRHSGVRVQVINPGFIRTRLTEKNSFAMPFIMTPEDAATRVLRAMQARRFQTSFPAPFSWLFLLGRFLPRSLFLRIFGS